MLRHVVLYRIKDEFKAEIPQLIENFCSMKGKIDGLLELESGSDIVRSARSYDLALVTLFRDMDSFRAYQVHPVHLPVKARMHEVVETSVSCDFELS